MSGYKYYDEDYHCGGEPAVKEVKEKKNEFAVGDLVVITKDTEYFSVGNIGCIISVYEHDVHPYIVDFNGLANIKVVCGGKWYCREGEIKHYTPIEDLPLWKVNHQYLDDEQQQVLRKSLHRVQWDEEYAEKIYFEQDCCLFTEAFRFQNTDEGHDYWWAVQEQVDAKEVPQNIIEEEETERTDYTSEYFLQRAIDLQRERGKTSKSDGGSSDYYKLKIVRAEDGSSFECELGDLIYSVFGGDFNLGNIVKACRRAWLQSKGCGKHGVTIEYDMNKIGWFSKDHAARTKQADSGAL